MRRAVLIAWGVGGLLALAAGSASAAAPEFGRCVKVAAGTGVYSTAKCTEEGGERKYEWLPGPGPRSQLTLSLKPETAFFLEASGNRNQMHCTGLTGIGDITGQTTVGNLVITLTGCESNVFKCSSSGLGSGEVALTGGTGSLGVIKTGETPLKDQIGLELSPEGNFECGGGLLNFHLQGVAIGRVPINAMVLKAAYRFAQHSGIQKPERFAGGPVKTLEWIENGRTERVGVASITNVAFEEKIEINTVV